VVARYALMLDDLERPDPETGHVVWNKDVLAEARQMEDRLGLTPKSMRMLLWDVASDEVAEKRAESTSARGRIAAVS
jgi:hypothetical protein